MRNQYQGIFRKYNFHGYCFNRTYMSCLKYSTISMDAVKKKSGKKVEERHGVILWRVDNISKFRWRTQAARVVKRKVERNSVDEMRSIDHQERAFPAWRSRRVNERRKSCRKSYSTQETARMIFLRAKTASRAFQQLLSTLTIPSTAFTSIATSVISNKLILR